MPTRRVSAGELAEALAALAAWLDEPGDEPGRNEPDRALLARAVRGSLQALAGAAPGHSVEVRVPPLAAVQCVAGPRHTRGTPPNVVETDPRTWLRLATGRLDFDQARRAGRLTASGTRASDLTRWLPVSLGDQPGGN